jgi:hypothetical protein
MLQRNLPCSGPDAMKKRNGNANRASMNTFTHSCNYFIFIVYITSATPLYPQKLAQASATSGGRSAGIVRSRTKATELV